MFSKHLLVYKYLLNNYRTPASFQPQGMEQDRTDQPRPCWRKTAVT